MSRNTARVGAVSVTDKHGNRTVLRSTDPETYLVRMRYIYQQWKRLEQDLPVVRHEHDFSPLFDGSKTHVCACGAVRTRDGEVY